MGLLSNLILPSETDTTLSEGQRLENIGALALELVKLAAFAGRIRQTLARNVRWHVEQQRDIRITAGVHTFFELAQEIGCDAVTATLVRVRRIGKAIA